MLNFTNQATQFDKQGYSDKPSMTPGYGQSENKQALTPSRTVNISRPQMDMSQMVSVMGDFTQLQPGAYPDRSMVFMDKPSYTPGKSGRASSNTPSSRELRAFFGNNHAPMMDEESVSNYYSSCAPKYEMPAKDSVTEDVPTENCEPETPAYPQNPSHSKANDRSRDHRPVIINNYYQQNNYHGEPATIPAADQTPKPPREMHCPPSNAEYPPPAADHGYYQDCPMEDSAPPKYCPPAMPKPPKHSPAPPANDYSYADCPMPAPPKPAPPKQPPANDYSYADCPMPAPPKPAPPKQPLANDYSYADCPMPAPPKPAPPKQPPANDYSYADCPMPAPPKPEPPKQPPAKDKMEDCPPPPPSYDGGDQGGYWGDPHLEGFDGEKYDVMGKAGNTYNMISDQGFQYNTKFIPLGAEGSTAIGEAGFQIGDDQVRLDAKSNSAWLNDKQLEANKSVDLKSSGSVSWSGSELKVNSKEYNVDLKLQKDEAGIHYIDSNVKLNGSPFADNVKPHGLLGQTADGVKGLKNNGKDLGKQGGTVIDSTVEDYEVSGLFDNKFTKNNRFNG